MRDMTQAEQDTRFLTDNVGLPVGLLSREEMETFHRLVREGKARRTYDDALGFLGCPRVGRVPVSYGDGKKGRYGPTYADELRGEFS